MLEIESHYQDIESIKELFIPYESTRRLKIAFSGLRLTDDQSWLNTKTWLGHMVKSCLPNDIANQIQSFKDCNDSNALIIRGLPLDENLAPTPYQGYVEPSKLPIISAINIGIYHLAGIEPISFQNENNGFLFRHVVPSLNSRNDKSSHGSLHTFGHHVDNPDLPLSCEKISDKSGCPEFLSLMAIRTDLRVRSNFILLDDVLSQLSSGVVKQLTKPHFEISRPDSFSQNTSSVLPLIVYSKSNQAYCRYDKENTTPLTKEAAAALVMFEAKLQAPEMKNSILYQPGDFLMIKNQRLMHSREGFLPRDDGTDRWLIRLFGMSSLERIVPVNSTDNHIGKD
ncbi:TauD/TfdA family dioxygenase [Photobacterium halotolerans]|uniref:TauD/TfdA family dioxygenase n=1 Tax=Photobacterium halotolerans TaxID=265726 RepID=UPI000419EF7B|nr:TauD/TfdA family dioxygenase [Photobacterium halotolerans]